MTLRQFKQEVLEIPIRFDNLEVYLNHPICGPHCIKVNTVRPVADDTEPEPNGPYNAFETYSYPTYILVR